MLSILSILGFAACDEIGNQECMYGTPTLDFQLKGTVTTEDDKPLEGIQVIVRKAWNNQDFPKGADTLYTNAQGEFATSKITTSGINEQKVYFNDVDGEKNGGTFKSDSVLLRELDRKPVKKGDNSWYQGEYEMTVSVKLSPAEAEEEKNSN